MKIRRRQADGSLGTWQPLFEDLEQEEKTKEEKLAAAIELVKVLTKQAVADGKINSSQEETKNAMEVLSLKTTSTEGSAKNG